MDDTERMLRDEYHAPEDFLSAYRTTGLWRFPGDREFFDRTGEAVLDQDAADERFDAARSEYCSTQPGEVALRLGIEQVGEGVLLMIDAIDRMRAVVDRIEREGGETDPAELEAHKTWCVRVEDGLREVHRGRRPLASQGGYWWQQSERALCERFGQRDDRGDAVEFTEDDCAYLEQWRRELAS